VTRSTGSSVHSDTCRRLLQASLALAGLSLLSGCELVALKVDLIVASGSPASFAAKRVTDTIPIVMGSLNADPVATGLIATLAHPAATLLELQKWPATQWENGCSCSRPYRAFRGSRSSGIRSIPPTSRS
jgi:hypothetical protein